MLSFRVKGYQTHSRASYTNSQEHVVVQSILTNDRTKCRAMTSHTLPTASCWPLQTMSNISTFSMSLVISFTSVISFSVPHTPHTFLMQLIPADTGDTRQLAYINISRATVNSNKTDGLFEINAAQYTRTTPRHLHQSLLPNTQPVLSRYCNNFWQHCHPQKLARHD